LLPLLGGFEGVVEVEYLISFGCLFARYEITRQGRKSVPVSLFIDATSFKK
jgi:hypothetical protein